MTYTTPSVLDVFYACRVDGGITFLSFVVFGIVPLLGYLIFYSVPGLGSQELFVIACCLTAITLFVLGAIKTKVTAQKWYLGASLDALSRLRPQLL